MSVRIAWESRGEGPPLLLIHGLGYARWGWEPVADGLAERFRVLLYDNRGIGESEAPPGPYTVEQLAGDALRVLDDAGVERAHVCGTSLGGMAALQLALDTPARVDRLVLACTYAGGADVFPMPAVTGSLFEESAAWEPELRYRAFVENALRPRAPAATVDRILAHRLATAQPLEHWQWQAAAAFGFDVSGRLKELEAPTLVLTGTADNVVDPRNSELLASRIPGARLERFEGCGHIFMWDEPERFVRVVSEFLG